jgi:multidrug resistance efflux pump
MTRLLIAAIFALAAPVAAADAASSAKEMARCQAMSATFKPKQEEIAKLKDARDAQAELVETKGEAWDDVEVLRSASKAHAKSADAAKADYETAKADLMRMELGLQEAVTALNADFEAYNQTCATRK